MLKVLSVVALAACMAMPSFAARCQSFVPDLNRSGPVPAFATYACRPFLPDGASQTNSDTVRAWLEQKYRSGSAYWRSIASEQDLLNRLNAGRALVPNLPNTQQWKAVLYAHCLMLNESLLHPNESHRYLEWIAEQYQRAISNGGVSADGGDGQRCGASGILAARVIGMWLAWNLFNNRLYGEANRQADNVVAQARSQAQQLQGQLGAVPIPQPGPNYQTTICAILSNGPLNDMAAALWVKAMSYYCTGQDPMADATFAELRSQYSKGRIYDPAQNIIWNPADPMVGKTCPR